MNELLLNFFDVTEAWAPLIPLFFFIFLNKDSRKKVAPTHWYFICAFVLNSAIDIIWKFNNEIPLWARDNNVLYNLQSPIRVALMGHFIHRLLVPQFKKVSSIAQACYFTFLFINYVFLQNILRYSSRANTAEPLIMLLVCLMYLFQIFSDDEIVSYRRQTAIWIVIGLLIYETTNFAIFLFYADLMQTSAEFATQIWHIHNAFYLLFCLLTAKGYYESKH